MNEVEILLVEDNPHDLEMTLRALRKNNLANSITSVTDGEAALDFLFARGKYSGRDINHTPRVVFLDLKLPKVDGIEVLRQVKSDERTDRKSTRLNSSHLVISYAVFCLK